MGGAEVISGAFAVGLSFTEGVVTAFFVDLFLFVLFLHAVENVLEAHLFRPWVLGVVVPGKVEWVWPLGVTLDIRRLDAVSLVVLHPHKIFFLAFVFLGLLHLSNDLHITAEGAPDMPPHFVPPCLLKQHVLELLVIIVKSVRCFHCKRKWHRQLPQQHCPRCGRLASVDPKNARIEAEEGSLAREQARKKSTLVVLGVVDGVLWTVGKNVLLHRMPVQVKQEQEVFLVNPLALLQKLLQVGHLHVQLRVWVGELPVEVTPGKPSAVVTHGHSIWVGHGNNFEHTPAA